MKKLFLLLFPVLFFVACDEPKNEFPEIKYSSWEEIPFLTYLKNSAVAFGVWTGDTIVTVESKKVLRLEFAKDLTKPIVNQGVLWCDTIYIRNLEWYTLPDDVDKSKVTLDSIGFRPAEPDTLFHGHSDYTYNSEKLKFSTFYQFSENHLNFIELDDHPIFGNTPTYIFTEDGKLIINNYTFTRVSDLYY